MYESGNKEQGGYGAESSYLRDVEEKYGEYQAASSGKTAFIPGIMPGYNDRRVRLRQNHYVIPRRWDAGAPEGTFFSRLFDRLGLKYADAELNMIMITSWNEWNEDTAIEPLRTAPPTTRDRSGTGTSITEGYAYTGFGATFLEIVRDKVVSVGGRVADRRGEPVRGVEVRGWSGGQPVASGRTDTDGRYRLSRRLMKEGEYEVGPAGGDRRRVIVEKDRATLNVDFVVARGK